MQTIWKYAIPLTGSLVVEMPTGARILDVQVQRGNPHIWASVDSEAAPERRYFTLFGTGHPMPDIEAAGLDYVGTFQVHGGSLVLHLFESAKNT